MDAYDCRSEYDFYNKFAASVIKQTSSKVDQWLENAKDYSVAFGITPDTHSPEEILSLPELIATKKNIRIVVCIDEFQQIGEFP